MKTEDRESSVIMTTIMKENVKSMLESVEETIGIIMEKIKTIMTIKMATMTTDKKIISVHGIVMKITMTIKMTEIIDRKMKIKAQKTTIMITKMKTNMIKKDGR